MADSAQTVPLAELHEKWMKSPAYRAEYADWTPRSAHTTGYRTGIVHGIAASAAFVVLVGAVVMGLVG